MEVTKLLVNEIYLDSKYRKNQRIFNINLVSCNSKTSYSINNCTYEFASFITNVIGGLSLKKLCKEFNDIDVTIRYVEIPVVITKDEKTLFLREFKMYNYTFNFQKNTETSNQ